ncbi:hypothetical protein OMAG_002223 [Candidatus Omnitrophus magneticus]|uniref:Uncharacterized protein n=1 Tax=Candidatus Omnitrophus magneticus TaxID=1609969 RepID=A0A0F0CPG0_9BACT|nr:hypothetical protein OMAG_002223 [Candidatus Omnitrophus magneticus]
MDLSWRKQRLSITRNVKRAWEAYSEEKPIAIKLAIPRIIT